MITESTLVLDKSVSLLSQFDPFVSTSVGVSSSTSAQSQEDASSELQRSLSEPMRTSTRRGSQDQGSRGGGSRGHLSRTASAPVAVKPVNPAVEAELANDEHVTPPPRSRRKRGKGTAADKKIAEAIEQKALQDMEKWAPYLGFPSKVQEAADKIETIITEGLQPSEEQPANSEVAADGEKMDTEADAPPAADAPPETEQEIKKEPEEEEPKPKKGKKRAGSRKQQQKQGKSKKRRTEKEVKPADDGEEEQKEDEEVPVEEKSGKEEKADEPELGVADPYDAHAAVAPAAEPEPPAAEPAPAKSKAKSLPRPKRYAMHDNASSKRLGSKMLRKNISKPAIHTLKQLGSIARWEGQCAQLTRMLLYSITATYVGAAGRVLFHARRKKLQSRALAFAAESNGQVLYRNSTKD